VNSKVTKNTITEDIDVYRSDFMLENIYHIKSARLLIDTASPAANSSLKQIVINLDREFDFVLLTHAHFDHIGNLDLFKNKIIVASEKTQQIIENKQDEYALFYPQNFDIDKVANNSYNFQNNLPQKNLEIIKTPGHLVGSIVLYDTQSKFLYTGDLIFEPEITGRYDLLGSSKKDLTLSLEKLNKLEILLTLPGHGQVCPDPHIIKKTLAVF
jgi:hydroxyacylglutathione hydrolase